MIRIECRHWVFRDIPEATCVEGRKYIDIDSFDTMKELAEKYDIMLTKRGGTLGLYLDDKGRRFRQR